MCTRARVDFVKLNLMDVVGAKEGMLASSRSDLRMDCALYAAYVYVCFCVEIYLRYMYVFYIQNTCTSE